MESILKLQKPWNNVKELLKEVNPDLTDEDLDHKQGEEEKMLEKVAGKMGRSAAEIKKWIESVSANKGISG